MSRKILFLCLVLLVRMWSSAVAADRPNILIVLTDDMGFSDLGCFGGEIETPNLDALAAGGLRFTEFYNTARCWPTRATLCRRMLCIVESSVPSCRIGLVDETKCPILCPFPCNG